MSASESHLSASASTFFAPPASDLPAVREWRLRGFRPDTSLFMAQIRRRQAQPFTAHISWQQETRLLALYCTDPDCTLADLITAFTLRRPQLRAMFAHYGLDYYRRDHARKEVR